MISDKKNKTDQRGSSGPFSLPRAPAEQPSKVEQSSFKEGPSSAQRALNESRKTKSYFNEGIFSPQHLSLGIVSPLFSGTIEKSHETKPNAIISSIFDYPTERTNNSDNHQSNVSGGFTQTPSVAPKQLFSPTISSTVMSNSPPLVTIPTTSSFHGGEIKNKTFRFYLFDLFSSCDALFIILVLISSPVLLQVFDMISSLVQSQYDQSAAWLSVVWPRVIELLLPVEACITIARELTNQFVERAALHFEYLTASTEAQLLLTADNALVCIVAGVAISLVLDWDTNRIDKAFLNTWDALPSPRFIPSVLLYCMSAVRACAAAVVEILWAISRLPWIVQSNLLYRLTVYFVAIFSLAVAARWACRHMISMAASTAASYGPAGLRAVVSMGFTFLAIMVVGFFYSRRRRRILAEQEVVNSVVLYVKRQLSEVHKGEPYPVEYFYEAIADEWRLPTSSPFSVFSTSAPSVTPLPSSSLVAPSEPFLRTAGVKWSASLWKQVKKEVEKDRRVLTVDIEVDGSTQRCWRMQTGQSAKKVWFWSSDN